MSEQAKYLTDEQLANKLSGTSFFNKNWTDEEVIKYTQEAYNILRSQNKTGLQSIEINNEIIYVFIKEDGGFDTAYGIYKYVVEDFR
ncbi:MAG: EndoU domain-containing protein [Lachnospiraceae bacterium]|nr:EndoU domain-containing protein [Lachnospiraceae bacterium]